MIFREDSHVSPKVALKAGVAGQDGAYLAESLLKKGYAMVLAGDHPRLIQLGSNTSIKIPTIKDPHTNDVQFLTHYGHMNGGMTDSTNLIRIQQPTLPDEISNLAAKAM
jgi:GDP-D-mannose dehydratase